MISDATFLTIAIIWVGGWGFVFFRYPAVICRLGRQQPTLQRLRMFRIIGAIEMALVLVGVVSEIGLRVFAR